MCFYVGHLIETSQDDEKQMSRRSIRDGAGAKQPTDYNDIARAGGLATSSKIPPIDVELDCMTAALARVFKAPGAAGDSGANLFYVFNGALHPFCGDNTHRTDPPHLY